MNNRNPIFGGFDPNTGATKLALASSWQRCKKDYKLSQHAPRPILRLQDSELNRKQEELTESLHGESKEIECLANLVLHARQCLVVADTDSTLLMAFREQATAADFERSRIASGYCWRETVAATNAVAMALTEKRTFTVAGKDHYYKYLGQLSCTGAPLFDQHNQLIGALVIAGLDDKNPRSYMFYRYILSLAAARIQARLFKNHYSDIDTMQLSLANSTTSADESINALCAVNASGEIIGLTKHAAELLGNRQHEELLGDKVDDVFGHDVDRLAALAGTSINLDNIAHGSTVFATPYLPPNVVHVSKHADLTNVSKKRQLNDWVGQDKAMIAIADRAKELYRHGVPLLLQGETGSGKQTFANALHNETSFSGVPFIALDCATVDISKERIDKFLSELDSLRSLNRTAKQKFAGTIYLKAVDRLSHKLQMVVVSLLDEIDVNLQSDISESENRLRVISSVQDEPNQLIEQGKLTLELLHRLNGACLVLQPLRKREDLRLLISQIAKELAQRPIAISDEAYALLLAYRWPGNFCELRNTIRYSLIYGNGKAIYDVDLPHTIRQPNTEQNPEIPRSEPTSPSYSFDENNPQHLRSALDSADWNVSKAARRLGVSRATLYRKIKAHQLSRS